MRDIGSARGGRRKRFPAIDVLLNNAGLAPPLSTLQESEAAPLQTVIETNISGLVELTRVLLPGLIARKGAVLNLSSVAATYPYRGGAVYGASKAFVRQFSLDLRADLHGTGVRVTSIEPGMVETEFTLVRTGGDRHASDALYAEHEPDDRRGHRRDSVLDRDAAAAPQHQCDRIDAGEPELRRLPGRIATAGA